MDTATSRLKSSEYILLCGSFEQWLEVLGYAAGTREVLPGHVREFLNYQEQTGKARLEQITATDAAEFIKHLKERTGIRTGRPYSPAHINKYIQALKLFSRYVRETGRSDIGFAIERMGQSRPKPVWLSKAEVQRLYEASDDSVLGMRDRAMLAVFYGCGLRLNEGASLEIKDIITDRKLLHVRKGKQYKERLVPVAEKNYREIKFYIDYGRPQLMQEVKTGALFLDANKGQPMQKQSLYIRIKRLVKIAKVKKKVGAHTLRHSIATHLLQSGMKLEGIRDFLGHADLDSTQIYTHLKNEPA
ncbi:MAG: tyrosine-type recombinase/integrase [Williamsia sp.]|nr:tyrosine-type recombinase/integrase [Williamsia sp.]